MHRAWATNNQDGGFSAGCNQAGPTCVNVTSGNDATRWFNQVGLGLRYQQTFGPVDFKVYGFWETAGKENLTTSAYATTAQARVGATIAPGVTGSAQNVHYDNLNFYKAGAAVTAFNLTAAIDYIGGKINGQLAMRPSGGANMNAIVTGLTYANGPITLGAEFGVVESQGDARLVGISQRHEYEVAFGGNYKLAPGVQLVGEYIYQYRHQGGFDFATGTLGTPGPAALNGTTTATSRATASCSRRFSPGNRRVRRDDWNGGASPRRFLYKLFLPRPRRIEPILQLGRQLDALNAERQQM